MPQVFSAKTDTGSDSNCWHWIPCHGFNTEQESTFRIIEVLPVSDASEGLVPDNYFLKPGYIYTPDSPVSISTVLGSCVSVCIFDRKRKQGGMNHFRFPLTRDREKATADYGNVATLAMVAMMLDSGSKTKDLVAQIVGGANNPEVSNQDIGRENVRIARKVLVGKKIRIISEDVGGTRGRKVVYNTANNELAVLKVDTIRKGDWVPYISDR